MNRNRLIAGVIAVVILLGLGAAGVALWRSKDQSRHTSPKTIITKLGYCSSGEIRPCIVGFSQNGGGGMRVDILIPASDFPNFYLTIYKETEGYLYECEELEDLPDTVRCIGTELFPGELLQFRLIAKVSERVLAEGQFEIIGLLLATPFVEVIESPAPTEPTAQFATPIFEEGITPIVPTATVPSYPNPKPGYPNP